MPVSQKEVLVLERIANITDSLSRRTYLSSSQSAVFPPFPPRACTKKSQSHVASQSQSTRAAHNTRPSHARRLICRSTRTENASCFNRPLFKSSVTVGKLLHRRVCVRRLFLDVGHVCQSKPVRELLECKLGLVWQTEPSEDQLELVGL